MRTVLGVDLGSSWRTSGSAVLSFDRRNWIGCTLGAIAWPKSACDPAAIASAIVAFALKNDVCAISLDGPQGWRDPGTSGGFVGRDCERLTKTPAKTGIFGLAIPRTWIRWIQFSIEVFDRLLETQHAILANSPENLLLTSPPDQRFYVLESFPTSTWRRAAMKPLPAKHLDLLTIQRFAEDLCDAFGLLGVAVLSGARDQVEHDNLQALVAALPAAGLLGGPCRTLPSGLPARMIAAQDGIPMHRAEGIIWDAVPILDRRRSSRVREDSAEQPANCVSLDDPIESRAFRQELRLSREACLRDAEGFDEVLFVIERLGSRLSRSSAGLGRYEPCLSSLARRSDLAVESPEESDLGRPHFPSLFDAIRNARNDALHQGAVARHLTARVIETALVLEDALAAKLETVQYLMVQQPLIAYLWQTMAAIRQMMLSNAFSYLPVRVGSKWYFLSDHRIATFLRMADNRREMLARTLREVLDDAGMKNLLLLDAEESRCSKDASPHTAVEKMKEGTPVLVVDGDDELLGLISPADLL